MHSDVAWHQTSSWLIRCRGQQNGCGSSHRRQTPMHGVRQEARTHSDVEHHIIAHNTHTCICLYIAETREAMPIRTGERCADCETVCECVRARCTSIPPKRGPWRTWWAKEDDIGHGYIDTAAVLGRRRSIAQREPKIADDADANGLPILYCPPHIGTHTSTAAVRAHTLARTRREGNDKSTASSGRRRRQRYWALRGRRMPSDIIKRNTNRPCTTAKRALPIHTALGGRRRHHRRRRHRTHNSASS